MNDNNLTPTNTGAVSPEQTTPAAPAETSAATPAAPSATPATSESTYSAPTAPAVPTAPASPYGTPVDSSAPASPYGAPATPASPYGTPAAPSAPASPYGAPATPASPYGTPADSSAPASPYGAPAAPASPYGTPADSSAPASPYGTPAAPASPYGTPADSSAPASPYGTPATPTSPYGTPADSSAPASPYGTPAAPASPYGAQTSYYDQYGQQQAYPAVPAKKKGKGPLLAVVAVVLAIAVGFAVFWNSSFGRVMRAESMAKDGDYSAAVELIGDADSVKANALRAYCEMIQAIPRVSDPMSNGSATDTISAFDAATTRLGHIANGRDKMNAAFLPTIDSWSSAHANALQRQGEAAAVAAAAAALAPTAQFLDMMLTGAWFTVGSLYNAADSGNTAMNNFTAAFTNATNADVFSIMSADPVMSSVYDAIYALDDIVYLLDDLAAELRSFGYSSGEEIALNSNGISNYGPYQYTVDAATLTANVETCVKAIIAYNEFFAKV